MYLIKGYSYFYHNNCEFNSNFTLLHTLVKLNLINKVEIECINDQNHQTYLYPPNEGGGACLCIVFTPFLQPTFRPPPFELHSSYLLVE